MPKISTGLSERRRLLLLRFQQAVIQRWCEKLYFMRQEVTAAKRAANWDHRQTHTFTHFPLFYHTLFRAPLGRCLVWAAPVQKTIQMQAYFSGIAHTVIHWGWTWCWILTFFNMPMETVNEKITSEMLPKKWVLLLFCLRCFYNLLWKRWFGWTGKVCIVKSYN